MQLPETPPPPLAPLWDRVLRARALPPDLDVQLLYVAIRDRLTHPEWEVRLHALRVLADLLPLSGNALSFPFDQVIDNLGHNSPNVRKAALDALKVFCTHCEDPECAARSILDKCSYNNIRPHSADFDMKVNIITGLILSIPSVMTILKRRCRELDLFPIFKVLGDKLFDSIHRDVALRSLMKLRRICVPRDYMSFFSRLDSRVQDKFRLLCELYDEDSLDVYYAPRKSYYRNGSEQPMVKVNQVFNGQITTPLRLSTDTSSEDSYQVPFNANNFAKVIIETEIKFDSDTAITMTVLEQNETESEKNTGSDDDGDNSDRYLLKYSDGESEEDSDVVVKKVRFGGESVKIRTPDSDNLLTSEDDNNQDISSPLEKSNIEEVLPETPAIVGKLNEIKREAMERESRVVVKNPKKSGIPLPVIYNKPKQQVETKYNKVKLKSKSLSELYDFFNKKNDVETKPKSSGFALTLTEVRSPEKVPSPVEPHREVEVLHNLQRSPTVSPRRQQTPVQIERDRFVLNLVASSAFDAHLLSPRPPSPLRAHYDWEELGVVPRHVSDQLHNTENWIAAVKAADQLHSTLLEPDNVSRVEPAALSLVQHMWALSDAVSAARAPAEGAVCAVVRSGSSQCIRQLLPALLTRAARDPPPAALPHALLQRLALHHLVDLIFEPDMIGMSTSSDSERVQSGQLRAALCLARAAGPAAVLAAVRRRLAGTHRANIFCNKLRERLNRPLENIRPNHTARGSQLPIPARRRARSTPPAAPPRPRRLRPLPDSAPLPGITQPGREYLNTLGTDTTDGRKCFHLLCGRVLVHLHDRVRQLIAASRHVKRAWKVSRVSRGDAVAWGGGGMRRLCCCKGALVQSAAAVAPDLVADLPLCTRDSSAVTNSGEVDESKGDESPEEKKPDADVFNVDRISETEVPPDAEDGQSQPPRTPSIHVEDVSEKSLPTSLIDLEHEDHSAKNSDTMEVQSQTSVNVEAEKTESQSEKSPSSVSAKSRSHTPDTTRSGNASPEVTEKAYVERRPEERDVRNALAECIVPVRHEDWEVIVNGLVETERLAADAGARAPAASWRASTRSTAAHVKSLRSRVARAACSTLGTLFEHRGRILDTELEEAAGALLDRCADVNRFLRGDAASALGRVACGGGCARAGVALVRRGATHRAGPVRAAAAQALARLVRHNGPSRILDLPTEPRTVILRAAGELLGDANPETRMHARHLCLALSEDTRFRQMLKDAMPPSRYRAIEKFVDKLRCR
ncbi:uncharacterized protein [Epargyreus clarus]|uniref:uncharacterized protein n=1 Tax=Epargyreus clarus TaxID=520877 RepID=UPI003C2C56B5